MVFSRGGKPLASGVSTSMPWTPFLFSFKGRITRRAYWLRFWLPLLLVCMIAVAVLPVEAFVNMMPLEAAQADPYEVLTPFAYIFMAVVNYLALAVSVKRCHDRDRSGWFLLIYFIPIIGELWVSIELGFLRGTAGANRFGPDPLQRADRPARLEQYR